jgi:ADP-heptose:LPS heptosyltransferase
MKKILFIPQRGIGDLIHALPLINSIKEGISDSEISIPIVDKRQEEDTCSLECLFNGIVKFDYKKINNSLEEKRISLYRAKDFPEKYKLEEEKRREFEREMYEYYLEGEKYDLSIVLRKFNLKGINCKENLNLSDLKKVEREHVVDRNLRFADILGIKKRYEFRLNTRKDISENFSKYIIFVLNAGRQNKEWDSKKYEEVANFCSSKGYNPVLIKSKMNLEDFYIMAKNSKAVIGPDTGLTHLADAPGTKVIGLYGPTRPYKFAPYNNQDLVISTNNTSKLMRDIKAEEVISKLENLLV